jgi:hypothetical protein
LLRGLGLFVAVARSVVESAELAVQGRQVAPLLFDHPEEVADVVRRLGLAHLRVRKEGGGARARKSEVLYVER